VGLKVAIVGLAQSSRHLAPWTNPEWELWGLAWDSERYRLHRVFEMHDMKDMQGATDSVTYRDLPSYFEKLDCCARVYMADAYPEVPKSERYPYEAVAEVCGDYWDSSVAYAVSLAIAEGAEEIGVYGVNMLATEEYAYQRPNMEYLLGLAKGKGIKVHIPKCSPLLKFSGFAGYHGKYGWRG
jgi:hypothetical protein